MKTSNIDNQRGHAAILFVMLIPLLFGVFILASDGARALQSKARIEDASEVAALAIAAHDDKNPMSAYNISLVNNYIAEYMVDQKGIEVVRIKRLACRDIPECIFGSVRGESRYTQYEVEVTSTHNSWFPGTESIKGMGETFTTRGASMVRKYQSNSVDLMFAADFSGSMESTWLGGRQNKYQDLITILNKVTQELRNYNYRTQKYNSTIGISGFNTHTMLKLGLIGCKVDQTIKDETLDYYQTVAQMWIPKGCIPSLGNTVPLQFYDVALTSNFDSFNAQINGFLAGGGTSSYQAIISGARMLNLGSNNKKLLIVISDGADNNPYDTQGLVNAGMCIDIINTLENKSISSGKNITARMAFIGFDFNPVNNPALVQCVGSDNIFKAESYDELLDQILELIIEEVGHLAENKGL